ncbi:MAG: SH3 domain-containing protein [Clostridia bacterium]|nr:SH3 domain-containing protein [Clostridia bacterium]
MPKTSRFLCVFLCVTLLFLSVFVPNTMATAIQGRITGDGVRLRSEANTGNENNIITSFSKGTIVQINNTVKDASENTWYNVTYGDNTGYVYGKYVEEITPAPYDPDFEKNLSYFPESYHAGLRAIHNAYPNWIFKADPVKISLDTAIDKQYGGDNMFATIKWVEKNVEMEWRDPRADIENPAHLRESRWTFASREAIAYFMDPRNGLTVSGEKYYYPNIFTFMEQGYDPATQTVEGLRTVIGSSFLSKGYDGNADAYIDDIMQAASESGVSPYVIAANIIAEHGNDGTSPLISGTYPGYEGYYNFFNYNATGDNIVVNGLEYAKQAGWNSRSASIIGGAKKYGSGYVSRGQDTFYYMDFDVQNNFAYQYANSLYDQCVKAYQAKKAYVSNANGALTFRIPVYSSMPDSVYAKPSIENYNPQPSPTPTPTPTPSRRKGDFDGDGQVTVKELATIRMYLLGVKSLSVEERSYIDVSGDNDVTVKDLALVRMYLLGLVTI